MTDPVFTPTAPLPPLTVADVRAAAHLLRSGVTVLDTMDADLALLTDTLHHHIEEQVAAGTEQDWARVVGLFELLTAAVCTPAVAARLPQHPYPGPDSTQPWLSRAVGLLPGVVVLAGDDAVLAALTGDCDPAALPDPTAERAMTVEKVAVAAAAHWVRATHPSKKAQERAFDAIFASWESWSPDRWPALDLDAGWRNTLGWDPFDGVTYETKEALRFARASCPLTYTSRYPSSPKGAQPRMAGANSKRRHVMATRRLDWIGSLLVTCQVLAGHMMDEAVGITHGHTPLFSAAPHRLTATPYRNITVNLTSGLRWGGLAGGRGDLPVPATVFPTRTSPEEPAGQTGLAKVSTTLTGPDLRVSIALPSKRLPALDETTVGIVRILADELLTHLPDLTDHARAVLTSWRDTGRGPYGSRAGRALDGVLDWTVGDLTRRGVDWQEAPPAHMLTRA